MKDRFLLLAFLGAIVAFCLGSCTSRQGHDALTITYQTMETLPQQRAALTQLVEAFQRSHPGIRVKIQVSPSGFQKLQAQIAAGDVPDVFYCVSDRLPALIHRQVVLDLKPFLAKDPSVDLSAYFPKTVEACAMAEGLYCFPFHFSTDVLFYNKDLFDKAELAYPSEAWTWGDFERSANILSKQSDGKVQQYGTLTPRPLLVVKSYGGGGFWGLRCVSDRLSGRTAL